jgi:[protein-PII] uridylyltransferase
VNRQLKHFPIGNKINLEAGSRGLFVLSFIAGDRPGLLARIARILDLYQVRLHRAKINTLGSRAEDVFWISGAALDTPTQSAALLTELLEKV